MGKLVAAFLAFGLLIPLQVRLSPARASTTTIPYGKNLIVDPGAEQAKTAGHGYDDIVKIPGWTTAHGFTADAYTDSGGDLTPTTPGPKSRGKNYFYGGPGQNRSTAVQAIKLTAFVADIVKGKVTYTLSAWLGGISGQGDNAALSVTFVDTKGKVLSSRTVRGPKSPSTTGLYSKHASGVVPVTAADVKLQFTMTRLAGGDNDGLADNLSLVLSTSTTTIPYGKNIIVDPGAEQAKTAGHGYDDIVKIPGWTTAHGFTADAYTDGAET